MMEKAEIKRVILSTVHIFFNGLNNRLIIIFLFLAFTFVLLFLLSHKNPLIVIEGNTRSLDYVVTNKLEGRIQFLMPVKLHHPDTDNEECMAGLFEPKNSTRVSYSLNKDTLVIQVENDNGSQAGSLIPYNQDRKPIPLSNQTVLSYGKSSKCTDQEVEAVRLPIWGPTNIGRLATAPTEIAHPDPFSGILLGADISLFGRNNFGNGIYPAGEFKIPAEVRLSSSGIDTEPAWGHAIFNPQSNQNELLALQMSLTTVAEKIIVKRKAAGPQPEEIKVGFLTRLTGDPLYAIIGIILAGLALLGESIVNIRDLCKK